MSFVQLKHDKKLGLPKANELLDIPSDVLKYIKDSCLVSFRTNKLCKPDKVISEVNACSRFINKFEGNVVFWAIESDSPIAPVILWDVAHTLSVGNTITMLGDNINQHYYEREYYNGCFEVKNINKRDMVFRKIKELPAEQCKGLDDWTFGIPTGPGDATMLNAVVKRILEFDIPKKEIILCGRPGDNFKYFDEVRIVGEDIPAPPVLISKKKNRIVDMAKYNNLCILHDRVFLPKDFYEVVKKFGDFYSYTTLQSLYFDDKYNLTPRRYSDYGFLCNGTPADGVDMLVPKSNLNRNVSNFSKELFADIESNNVCINGNAINYNLNQYPTGSLYIVKKNIWKLCPQDENLKWEEFEDVESGLRANEKGIVCRINPYGFTQSILSRPIILGFDSGAVDYLTNNRKIIRWKAITNKFKNKNKPLFRIDENSANDKMIQFKEKYCTNGADIDIRPIKLSTEARQKIIMKLIYKSEFELSSDTIKEFIDDCNKLLFLDTIPYSMKRHLYYSFIHDSNRAKEELVFSPILINQLSLRNKKNVFMKQIEDYFCKNSLGLKIGTFISALYLNKFCKKIIYNPNRFRGYYKAILNSTPFIEYIKEGE